MPAGYACGLRSADCDGSLGLRGRNPSKPSRVHRSARPVRCGPSDLSHFRRGETFDQDLELCVHTRCSARPCWICHSVDLDWQLSSDRWSAPGVDRCRDLVCTLPTETWNRLMSS